MKPRMDEPQVMTAPPTDSPRRSQSQVGGDLTDRFSARAAARQSVAGGDRGWRGHLQATGSSPQGFHVGASLNIPSD